MELTFKERFEEKIFYSPDGCWYWLASLNSNGYGLFSINGKIIKAHRVSYLIYKGNPEGEFVLHSCDNRVCVNPDHLRLGTPADNMIDMVNKGRSNHGEKHPSSKLTEIQIRVIREAATAGHRQRDIVKYFKSNPSSISLIVNRKQWTRVV